MADKPNPFLKLLNQVKADGVGVKAPSVGSGGGGAIPRSGPEIEMHMTPKPAEKNTSDSVSGDLTSTSVQATPVSSASQEKASLPELTPQAQRLLGSAPVEPAPSMSYDEFANAMQEVVPSDTQELASINTDSMEPTEGKRETNLNMKAKAFGNKLQLESADSVRALCDRIDAMIGDTVEGASAALQGPNLITIRNHVQSLMVTLKSRPEFDSVMIAKDVRNVMKFIRATREETLELREIKTTKKAVRAAKKEVTSGKAKGFDDAFKSVMFGSFPGVGGGK